MDYNIWTDKIELLAVAECFRTAVYWFDEPQNKKVTSYIYLLCYVILPLVKVATFQNYRNFQVILPKSDPFLNTDHLRALPAVRVLV